MLSASAMLIRFERIVWRKRHHVLNPVWHLKGLNIIILLPSQSVFLQTVGFLSVCLICQPALKLKTPRGRFLSFESSWWFEIVLLDLNVSLHIGVVFSYKVSVRGLRCVLVSSALHFYPHQRCLHVPHEWVCVASPGGCQSCNTEKKDERKLKK